MTGDDPHEYPFPLRQSETQTADHTSVSANILKVTVSTNCPRGGAASSGGVTTVEIEDEASTSMSIEVHPHHAPAQTFDLMSGKFRLVFQGDTECDTLIDCLEFAAKTLRAQRAFNIGLSGSNTPLGLNVRGE